MEESLQKGKAIVVIGHGGCGKDAFANCLHSKTGLAYSGSISWYMKSVVSRSLRVCEMTAWDTRRDNREEWASIIDKYREGDAARVIREMVESGSQIITGVRRREEFSEALKGGLIDHTVWIDRPYFIEKSPAPAPELVYMKKDTTLELSSSDADYTIENTGTMETLKWLVDGYIHRVLNM